MRSRFSLALAFACLTVFAVREADAGPVTPASSVAPEALLALPPPPEPEPIRAEMFGPSPKPFPRGRAVHLEALGREAEARGLPPAVADAVAMVESAYDPAAIGGVGEIGMMQVLPSTAHLLGFRGTLAELAEPATNMRYGVTYLAQAWRLAGGDLCRTLMKYRAGHGEERMSALSVAYCVRARSHLAAIGSPLAQAAVPEAVAAAGFLPPAGAGKPGRRRVVAGLRGIGAKSLRAAAPIRRAIWAASDKRMKAIEAKVTPSTLSIMR